LYFHFDLRGMICAYVIGIEINKSDK